MKYLLIAMKFSSTLCFVLVSCLLIGCNGGAIQPNSTASNNTQQEESKVEYPEPPQPQVLYDNYVIHLDAPKELDIPGERDEYEDTVEQLEVELTAGDRLEIWLEVLEPPYEGLYFALEVLPPSLAPGVSGRYSFKEKSIKASYIIPSTESYYITINNVYLSRIGLHEHDVRVSASRYPSIQIWGNSR